MKLIPFANYPLRPRMETGESLVGYVYRFLGVNGYKIDWLLFRLILKAYGGSKSALNNLREIIGAQKITNNVKEFRYWLNAFKVDINLQKKWISFNRVTLRLCPRCFKERQIHFAVWENPLVHACPLHGCRLLSRCQGCGQALQWKKLQLGWVCSCGQEILHSRICPAKSGMTELSQIVATYSKLQLPVGYAKCLGNISTLIKSEAELHILMDEASRMISTLKKTSTANPESHKIIERELMKIGWSMRLIFSPNHILEKRIKRCVRYQFKPRTTIIKSLSSTKGLAKFEAEPESKLRNCIVKVLSQFIAVSRVSLPLDYEFYFNPKFSADQIEQCLIQFSVWWSKLVQLTAILDDRVYAEMLQIKGMSRLPTIDTNRFVYQITQSLLQASYRDDDVSIYYPLTHWWRIPAVTLRNIHEPKDTLYHVCLYLLSITDSELIFVHSLVMHCEVKCKQQREIYL